ncbi:MAG: tryptophan--tRNA ligase [Candidatus Saccharimonadales bacterium]
MTKPVILTGIRANNDLHIGNYFGALLPLIDMAKSKADDYDVNLFVPDLHSFTTPIDHSLLNNQIMHNLRIFVAAGLPLDHPNIHIYRQSYVPAHSELTWILDCFTGFGEMRRMTQFKDKSNTVFTAAESELPFNNPEQDELEDSAGSRISVGLFNYPVLMAADILLYGAEYVPVGDDQTQHLEFARDIAERMNNKFGGLFTIPKPVKGQHAFFGKEQGLRIKDLAEPTKKMSKSDETGKGIIFLGDSPEAASKKIMSATTDSIGVIHNDLKQQPGVVNLLQILALASDKPLSSVIDQYEGQTSYGALKQAVAANVAQLLSDFQAKLTEVDDSKLLAKLEADEAQMNKVANAKLLEVQKAVGLR